MLYGLWDFHIGILSLPGGPDNSKEAAAMRGYFTAAGFYGLVDGRYMLFSSESEYYEFMESEADEADAS